MSTEGIQHESQSAKAKIGEPDSPEIEPGCSGGEFLEINDISLYYEVHGQGEPLLLMHTGNGSARDFDLMLPELTKHFLVITPDSRGQGRSTDTDEPLSYRQMVEDMIALLDSLGIDSAYVGGLSDGAAIAIHLAIHYPERVRALLVTAVDLFPEALAQVFWKQAEQWNLPEKLVTMWNTRPRLTEEELAGIRAPTLIVAGKQEQYVKHDHIEWHIEPFMAQNWYGCRKQTTFSVLTRPTRLLRPSCRS